MQINKNTLYIICFALFFAFSTSKAQETASFSNLIVNNWNNKNGLPQNTIFDLAIDSQEKLWFSTEEGIVNFDGVKFNVFNGERYPNFQDDLFNSIVASIKGGIWACNNTDLVYIDEVVEVYKLSSSSTGDVITSIGEDSTGKLWIGTKNGNIFYFDDATKRIVKSTLNLKAQVNLIKAVSGGILIGTTEGLYKYSTVENKLNYFNELGAVNITAVSIENDRAFWVGTQVEGLFYFNNNSVTQYTEKDGLKENFILALAINSKGEVYVGTSSSGIQIYRENEFIDFEVEDINFHDVKSLFIHKELLWIGTSGSGLYLIEKAEVQRIPSTIQLTGNVILPIYEDIHKNIWIGTAGNGVNKIINDDVVVFRKDNGLSNEIILSIYGSDSAVYIGTANGLNKINYGSSKVDKIYTTRDGLASNIIKSVYFSTQEQLWVTTRSGGIHYLNSSGKFTQLKLPKHLSDADFTSIFEDSNRAIWIGTENSGIIVIESGNKPTHLPLPGNLATADVLSFYEDDENNIWAGTDKGLLKIDEGEYFLLNKENGLKFNEAHNIIEDDNNIIWISGNHGIQAFSADDLKLAVGNSKDKKITVQLFNSSKGMKNEETNGGIFPAGTRLSNGKIWFPTVEGIAVIDPEIIMHNKVTPNVFIEHLKFGDQVYTDINKIKIPPGTINIEIAYSSINFSEPSSTNYFYRIKELGMDWENVGNRRTGYFTLLEPNNYTFEVKSELYGNYSEVKSFSFVVTPFFYQTVWFRLIVIFALASLFLLAIDDYYRRKKHIELARLVDLRTSELKQSNEKLKTAIKDVEEQNLQLKDIAWTQSHVVRAPLARILGFINLMSRKNLDEEVKFLVDHIKNSGNELDIVIREVVRKSEDLVKKS